MNVNPLLLLMLGYIAFFGVSVNLTGTATTAALSQCKPIPAPVLQVPPVIPVINKPDIENKEFVIRVLINHIREQNLFIDNTNKEVTKIYNSYTACAVK